MKQAKPGRNPGDGFLSDLDVFWGQIEPGLIPLSLNIYSTNRKQKETEWHVVNSMKVKNKHKTNYGAMDGWISFCVQIGVSSHLC